MATLTVRNLDDDVVRALRIRAAEHGRSAEAEHREILRTALTGSRQPSLRVAAAKRLAEFPVPDCGPRFGVCCRAPARVQGGQGRGAHQRGGRLRWHWSSTPVSA
ncbi:FitA-like ribbon-helix-helix domain-containing protein [Siccirubricoccus sp. G192]|uniref:FitA-like ribbon-helix-helix domain-containing protein n=1 Tax=Siccirubricoccus sp. G192 TaxID=2849651 RepID=UPI0035C7C230